MPASVTSNFRIANAKAFVDSFEEPENGGRNTVVGQSYVYLFIGKILSWDKTHAGYSDAVIPSPDGDVQGNEYEPWRDMIALDRVFANTDISLGAKRYDWASGEVYTQYDDQDPTITKATSKYYVYTDTGRVFKCLDNNDGAVSTVNPAIDLVAALKHLPFVTADGYRWKYMCTVTAGQTTKWLSTNYIPIRTLNAIPQHTTGHTELVGAIPEDTNFSDQADVQKNAKTGSIETYVVVSGGAGFTKHSGSLPADSDRALVPGSGTNTTFFSVKSSVLPNLDFEGAAIFLSNSSYQKGVSVIQSSGELYAHIDVLDHTPGAVTVDGGQPDSFLVSPAFADELAPLSGDTYHIGPVIEVTGDGPRNADGTGGANAYSICTPGGRIRQINAWTTGNNYTTAIVSETGGGSGLVARAVIPPPGGHGFDPVAELGAFNVIISKRLLGSGIDNLVIRDSVIPTGTSGRITGNNFPISNEFRTIGLIRNPYIREDYDATVLAPASSGKNWYANSSPLHQSTWIVANGINTYRGDNYVPQQDDEIKGAQSGATGRVIEYNTDDRGIINITNVTANSSGGSFVYDERLILVRNKSGGTFPDENKWITANGWAGTGVADYNNTTIPTGSLAFDGTSTVIYEPDLQPYTGDILYLENRSPITRSKDQSEDIKIVVEF